VHVNVITQLRVGLGEIAAPRIGISLIHGLLSRYNSQGNMNDKSLKSEL
jgi:hypothetical protein